MVTHLKESISAPTSNKHEENQRKIKDPMRYNSKKASSAIVQIQTEKYEQEMLSLKEEIS